VDSAWSQVLTPAIGTVLGASAALLSSWLTNRSAEKRHRAELESQERRHNNELHARFFECLMSPRVNAHAEILGRLYDLQMATHYFLSDARNGEYKEEFERALNQFRGACGLHRTWIRTTALEALSQIDRDGEDWRQGKSLVSDATKRFAEARLLLEWSLGLEDLELFMRGLQRPDPRKC